jgi:hypothetical protein
MSEEEDYMEVDESSEMDSDEDNPELEESIKKIEDDLNFKFKSKVAEITKGIMGEEGKTLEEKEKEITSKVFNVFMDNKTDLLQKIAEKMEGETNKKKY